VARRDAARRFAHRDLRLDSAALRVDETDGVGRHLAGGARVLRSPLRQQYAEDRGSRGESDTRGGGEAPVAPPPRPPHLRDRLLGRFGKLALTALEERRRGRLQRREALVQAGRQQLVDPLRLVEVLQRVLTEVAKG